MNHVHDEALPEAVWRWVDLVAAPTVRIVQRSPGGFAMGGVRGRVETADGGDCFLKARLTTDAEVRDDEIEAMVLGILPAEAGAPRLLGATRVAGWHVTVTEFVGGVSPAEPMPMDQLRRVLDHVGRMGDALKLATPPVGMPSVLDRMRGRAGTWASLRRTGRTRHLNLASLTRWERAHLERLDEGESRFAGWPQGGGLLHFDLRYDNILLAPDGAVRIIDWGRACVGPAWVDPVCLLLESRVEATDLDTVFLDATRGDPPAAADVDAFLSMLASYWREAAEDERAPATLRARRRTSLQATEAWLASRWG